MLNFEHVKGATTLIFKDDSDRNCPIYWFAEPWHFLKTYCRPHLAWRKSGGSQVQQSPSERSQNEALYNPIETPENRWRWYLREHGKHDSWLPSVANLSRQRHFFVPCWLRQFWASRMELRRVVGCRGESFRIRETTSDVTKHKNTNMCNTVAKPVFTTGKKEAYRIFKGVHTDVCARNQAWKLFWDIPHFQRRTT